MKPIPDQLFEGIIMPKPKILLIDDDQNIHLIFKIILEKAGYEFISAHDGLEGLRKILETRPDLVILDYMMPQMDGEEIFNEFLTNPRYRDCQDIPFIILTARQEKIARKQRLFEKGLTAYLTKPFGHRELLNIIDNVLASHAIHLKNRYLNNAIREAKNFLENLIESIPEAIFIINCEGQITFYNGGHQEVLQYDLEEIIHKPVTEIFDSTTITLEAILQNIQQGRNTKNLEVNLISKTGKKVPFAISLSEIKNEDDQFIGIVLIGRDISELKRLQQELVEKEKLAMLSETAIAINHEINNPLAPILGNVQLILRENKFDEKTRNRLHTIQRNAQRIYQIIQKLQAIKKPVTTKYVDNTKMLDIFESK